MIERTLAIIKPDAVSKKYTGSIIKKLEEHGLNIVDIKMVHRHEAAWIKFYEIHKNKPFFNDLINFMSSGSSLVMILEGQNAVTAARMLIGATNPLEASEGTLRKDFAESIDRNAVHGSDSKENAAIEIDFFFPKIK